MYFSIRFILLHIAPITRSTNASEMLANSNRHINGSDDSIQWPRRRQWRVPPRVFQLVFSRDHALQIRTDSYINSCGFLYPV